MKSILFYVGVLMTMSVNTQAQVVATADASATIVSPLAISKTADMNFGNLAVTAAAGGVVTLEASAAATRTETGTGVSFPAAIGTVTAARFVVSGAPNYTYQVTLPAGAILENGPFFMFANNFTQSVGAGVLDATGIQAFYVGADLTVAAGQASGVYTTTTPFVVLINYN